MSGGRSSSDEAAWRDLVARYDLPADADADDDAAAAPWPVQEDLAPEDGTRVIRQAAPAAGPGADQAATAAEVEEEEEEEEDTGDEDGHFIPPPPPLPQLDPVAKAAWTGLFGGPAYLLLATLTGWGIPGWAALVAIAAFIGGFATLVIRMGDGPSKGDGPDSGAVL
jgi:hypothetical protein